MTINKPAFAIALLTLAIAACSGGHEAPTAEEGAHAESEAPKSSSAGLPAGHVDAGEKLASTKQGPNNQQCTECHGAEGNMPKDEVTPRLAGQYADYIEHALLAYRKGDRQHDLMGPQAKELTDQQIADLAAYFSSRPGHLADLHEVQ
jgi:cytochrome c553